MGVLGRILPIGGNIDTIKRIAVLSGAGVSAESGLKTFRDQGGLWEKHSIYEVATPEAWARNPQLVQDFYNKRRLQLLSCEPNAAHRAIAALEEKFEVMVITQNIDDLHERGGSKQVLHLHGELLKARSTADESLLYDVPDGKLKMGDLCAKGSQLRPHVVWFGEPVPAIPRAASMVAGADLLLVIGTSLSVYPAAGLVDEVKPGTPVVLIDPGIPEIRDGINLVHIRKVASVGMREFNREILGLRGF